MRRGPWLGVVAAILGMAGLRAARGAGSEPERSIGRVVVRGLSTIEEPFVRLSVGSSAGSPLTTAGLERDAETLRNTGLFRRAEASWAEGPDGRAVVTFEVDEAPPVSSVEVSGVTLVDVGLVEERARALVTGMPTRGQLVALGGEIAARYAAAGYFGCGLRSTRAAELTADGRLRLFVVEPRLGGVTVVGARRVRERDIRRKLSLRRGAVLRIAAMDAGIRHLASLGTLQSAAFDVERVDEDRGLIFLRLTVVEETHMGEVEVGVRYEEVRGAHAIISATRRNVFHEGKTFRLETQLGAEQSYSAQLSTDWLLGLPVSGDVGVHSTEILREAREGTVVVSRMDERRTGWMGRLRKILPGSVAAEMTFRDETIEARGRDGYLLPANLAEIGGDDLFVSYPQQTVGVTLHRGPQAAPVTRTERQAQRLTFETAGGTVLDGPGNFWSGEIEHRGLVPLDGRSDLAFRLRVGGIVLREGILPYLERKGLGGGETLRGYLFKEFTGDRLVLANVEYRRRLGSRVGGVVFVDWGDCWEADERGQAGKVSAGVGARIDVKLFLLRIDAGRARDRDGVEVTFGVGHLF